MVNKRTDLITHAYVFNWRFYFLAKKQADGGRIVDKMYECLKFRIVPKDRRRNFYQKVHGRFAVYDIESYRWRFNNGGGTFLGLIQRCNNAIYEFSYRSLDKGIIYNCFA